MLQKLSGVEEEERKGRGGETGTRVGRGDVKKVRLGGSWLTLKEECVISCVRSSQVKRLSVPDVPDTDSLL